ncbi:Hypothetical protein FKW44_014968 [Caligus rogercresseyi]|uniref:Uncharacterized protein n=1 Tax=Caligus rogercresseyi TaxID=217165 RepID=A0A7T8H0H2_CALRO|nr:Hypothetical protein FKW44_014968 [Caligus rogercresseyi]
MRGQDPPRERSPDQQGQGRLKECYQPGQELRGVNSRPVGEEDKEERSFTSKRGLKGKIKVYRI